MFTTSSLVALNWPFVVRSYHLRVLVVVVARIVGAFLLYFLGGALVNMFTLLRAHARLIALCK